MITYLRNTRTGKRGIQAGAPVFFDTTRQTNVPVRVRGFDTPEFWHEPDTVQTTFLDICEVGDRVAYMDNQGCYGMAPILYINRKREWAILAIGERDIPVWASNIVQFIPAEAARVYEVKS